MGIQEINMLLFSAFFFLAISIIRRFTEESFLRQERQCL